MKNLEPLTTDNTTAIIELGGLTYRVSIEVDYSDGVPSAVSAGLEIVSLPLTEKVPGGWVEWLGYPKFRQGPVYPHSDDGRPYTFICSVDDCWGDMGTANIFFLFKKNCLPFEIEDVYMEASCS